MAAATISVTGFPVAVGKPDQTARSIPFLFSTQVLMDFYARTILREITNTAYEKELRAGGYSIRIRRNAQVTVSTNTYVSGGGYTVQNLQSRYLDFPVDQECHYSFTKNIIDLKQQDIDTYQEAQEDATKNMKIAVETNCFAHYYSEATHSGATAGTFGDVNLGTTGAPLVLTPDNILDFIVDLGVVMDEVHTPEESRFVVFPPKICGWLQQSDLRNASFTGTQSKLIHPQAINEISGIMVYKSTLQPSVTDGADTVVSCIAGHKEACGFVMQIEHSEVKPNFQEYGDYTAGLHVFGRKVLRPAQLIHIYAKVA